MKRSGLLLAILLVIVVNITLLAGVWYNRSGPPDALVILTERELGLVGAREDDSSVALRFNFRAPQFGEKDSWLDRAKLEELGFDIPNGETARDIHRIRSVFVVLELEDESCDSLSRLMAVDAGLDAEELRRRYGDRSRYIVAPGSVRSHLDSSKADEEQTMWANIQHLGNPWIHVPKEHAGFISKHPDIGVKNRWAVTLRYGRRLEPWVVKVEPLDQE